MNCGGDRGTIRVEIWHRLKDPVQTDRMGAPPLRPQGAEPAAGGRPGGAGPGGAPSGRGEGRAHGRAKPLGKHVSGGSGAAGWRAAGAGARAGRGGGPHPAGCREWNRKEKRRWVRS